MNDLIDSMIDWSMTKPIPLRPVAVFAVSGCISFIVALIVMTLLMAWWAPMSSVILSAAGCGIGIGIANSVISGM